MPDESIEAISEVLAAQFARINTHYLELAGQHIKEVGTLSPTNLHRLQQMMRMGADIDIIQQELAAAANTTAPEVLKLLDRVAYEAYQDAAPFYAIKQISQLPYAENIALQRVVKAIEKRTLEEFVNLSQTTVVRETYSKAIDNVITAVQSGLTDYNTAIRQTLRETAKQGLRVEYASGHTRRLDSAVRQNVLDGVRYINQGVQDEAGRQFGADGVELSAHMYSAADHEPYQGQQMPNEEFELLQGSLPRPFGQWNCHHIIFRILMGISVAAHSKEELEAFAAANKAGVEYDGKHYTMYQATQEQRKMETAMRYGQDVSIMAKAAGDTAFARDMTTQVQGIKAEYGAFSKAAGLPTRYERMSVAMQRWANGTSGGILNDISGQRHIITPDSINKIPQLTLAQYDGRLLQKQQAELLRSIQDMPVITEASAYYSLSGNYLAGGIGKDGRAPAYTISQPHISIHNHPSGLTFSATDINNFIMDENIVVMSVTGNNGTSYALERSENIDVSDFIHHYNFARQNHPARLNSTEQYLAFINEFLEGVDDFGFTYYR